MFTTRLFEVFISRNGLQQWTNIFLIGSSWNPALIKVFLV